MKKKIVCVFGTRPEYIKMFPLILLLKKERKIDLTIISTGQHKELIERSFSSLKIKPDINLTVMRYNQDLSSLTSRLISKIKKVLREINPDFVLAQGDTTTTMTTSLVCFYLNIPFGHVEAGLRTYDLSNPFPEEANRCFISKISTLHFAPTKLNKKNLLNEQINKNKIIVTGNTVIDTIKFFLKKKKITNKINQSNKKKVLITLHRRENHGKHLLNFINNLNILLKKNENINFIFISHPNPNIKQIINSKLNENKNLKIIPPLDYLKFINLLSSSYFLITDSGGLQEEASFFGKPLLILRKKTERIEGVKIGLSKLINPNGSEIIKKVNLLLDDKLLYKKMSKKSLIYGNGFASKKIIIHIKKYLKI